MIQHRSVYALMLCWLLLLGGAAVAGQFDDGLAAYDQGRFEKAFELWRPLAQQGNAAAQFNLAALYEKGSGVAQDRGEGARWYLEAAKQGDLDAQLKIASLYEEGAGVAKDAGAAIQMQSGVFDVDVIDALALAVHEPFRRSM